MFSTNALLGAIAGITIFIGLPVARWRGLTEKFRGILTLIATGVLIFLFIEIGYQAMESVERNAASGMGSNAILYIAIFVFGMVGGLVGLAWFDDSRRRKHPTGETEALAVATMIAIGIGLHNFAEGLVIGQSFAGGAVGLGTVLVVGFALHNATEGFGIAGPLSGTKVGWGRLFLLGLIGGLPTVFGALIGGVFVNPFVELLFNSLAIGSLIYVTRELFRLRFNTLGSAAAMTAIAVGFLLGFGTELITKIGQSNALTQAAVSTGGETIRFANKQVNPVRLTLERGKSLTIENGESITLVFEGNGMYPGEIAVPPGDKITVLATGLEGQYKVVDERGLSASAIVILQAGGNVEPFENEVNAVGALMVLEGHVRTSKDLHDRGVSNQGPSPELDLKRAGKHAGHPQHELLMGGDPDALNLQKFLRERGVYDSLNNALTEYVAVAGKPEIPQLEVEQKYKTALAETERARRAIGGTAYDTANFRARAARFAGHDGERIRNGDRRRTNQHYRSGRAGERQFYRISGRTRIFKSVA